jgi:predicted dehydrogenase
MIRIGIIGSDNSHAVAYSKLANIANRAGDSRVVAISGPDPERTKEVAGLGNIPEIVERPEDMIGKVDAILVVHRHGDLHAEHAIPFLEAGIPVYVDKPFAVSLADCHAMLDAANDGNALLTSYSSLRYAPTTTDLADTLESLGEIRVGQFAGPCDFDSEYAGPFFYATHVAEICFRLMGDDIRTVSATRSGANVVADITFANDAIATFSYLGDAAYHFHATLFGTKDFAATEVIAGDDAYAEGLNVFLDAVKTGEAPLSAQQLLTPIAFVHALQESLANDGSSVDVASLLEPSVQLT